MRLIRTQRFVVALLALTAAAATVATVSTPAHAAAPEAEKNFSLLDYDGKHYELRRADAAVVVLFFTGADCPIARQLAPKLNAIQEEFGKQRVVVWMVNATPQNDPDERRLD